MKNFGNKPDQQRTSLYGLDIYKVKYNFLHYVARSKEREHCYKNLLLESILITKLWKMIVLTICKDFILLALCN